MKRLIRSLQTRFRPDYVVVSRDGRTTIPVMEVGRDCWGLPIVQDADGHVFRPQRRDLFSPGEREKITRRKFRNRHNRITL